MSVLFRTVCACAALTLILAGCKDNASVATDCDDSWDRFAGESSGLVEPDVGPNGDATLEDVRWGVASQFYASYMAAGPENWEKLPSDKRRFLVATVQTIECYWPSDDVESADVAQFLAQMNATYPTDVRQRAVKALEDLQ